MKSIFILLLFFTILLVSNTNSFAQLVVPFTAPSNASGEETILHLEMIVGDVKNKGERLFIISRLGKNEAHRLNNVRLMTTKWKLSTMGLEPSQTIFAEGERIKGEGRIEFYLGSNLRLVIFAKHNQMPNLTCCPDYFPPAKRKTRKRKM
jgi:hypothetical protein